MTLTQTGSFQTYFEDIGSSTPLIFVHGLGSSTLDWQPQVAWFSRYYRVVVYDLRGHGRSEIPSGPYTMPLFAHDLLSLLDELKIRDAHIVGLSLGGAIALQFGIDYPQRVRSLTIVNSGPSLLGDIEKASAEIDHRVSLIEQYGMKALAMDLSAKLFPSFNQAHLRQVFIARWEKNNPTAYIAALRSLVGWDVRDQLATIRSPTLILCSDQDYTPVDSKRDYARMLTSARVQFDVVTDAHHMLPVEKPDAFNVVLQTFLT